jgi:hypothetical protein
MIYTPWSEEETELLKSLLRSEKELTYDEVAVEINKVFENGRTWQAVRGAYRRAIDDDAGPPDDDIEFPPRNAKSPFRSDHEPIEPASFSLDEKEPESPSEDLNSEIKKNLPKEVEELMDLEGVTLDEVTVKDLGNNIELLYIGKDLRTVEELQSEAKLGEEWVAVNVKPNKWSVGMKVPKRQYMPKKNDYVTAGWEIIKLPLYQIKATFVKVKPDLVEWPLVQPVTAVDLPDISAKTMVGKAKHKPLYKDLIVSDAQIGFYRYPDGRLEPFHDRKALDLVLQAAQEIKYDRIWIIGDFVDLADWSDHFVRSPEVYFTTQPMLNEAYWWLYQLRQTGAEVIFIEGNHEARLPRVLAKNSVQSLGLFRALENTGDEYPIMSIPNWLRLKELGIEYKGGYPNSHDWVNKNLRISHGEIVRSTSMDTVRKMANDNSRYSEVVGHIHRLETCYRSVHPYGGVKMYGFYSVGTLARLQPPMPPAGISRVNWQSGFGDIDYQLGNGFANVNLYPIWNGNTFFERKVFSANPDVDKMAEEAIACFK